MNAEDRITIWVDADSFPAMAKDYILETAAKKGFAVNYVANRNIPFTRQNSLFSMTVCPGTSGAADDYIAGHCRRGDLVATRDIPLAQRLVEMEMCVINDRGVLFDKKICEEMMEQRELNLQMIALKVHSGKRWDSYGNRELAEFKKCLNRTIETLCSNRGGNI